MGMISVLQGNPNASGPTIDGLLAEDVLVAIMSSADRPRFAPSAKFYNSSSLTSVDGHPAPRLEVRLGPDRCLVEWKVQTRGSQRWLVPIFVNNLSTYLTPAVASSVRLWASPFERLIEETVAE